MHSYIPCDCTLFNVIERMRARFFYLSLSLFIFLLNFNVKAPRWRGEGRDFRAADFWWSSQYAAAQRRLLCDLTQNK